VRTLELTTTYRARHRQRIGAGRRVSVAAPKHVCEIRPRAAQLRPVTGRLHVYPARVIGQSRRNRMNPDLSVILACYRLGAADHADRAVAPQFFTFVR